MAFSQVTNEQLAEIRQEIEAGNKRVRAWMIKQKVKEKYDYDMDESTIRGRFIEMGNPLSGGSAGTPPPKQENTAQTPRNHINETVQMKEVNIPDELKAYIPRANEFSNYVERDVDKRLACHYNLGKYPITQGKQGTGKTYGHMYYAFKYGLPFFLFSCYEDFKLPKLFGDKTIEDGTIKYRESLFVRALQNPSVNLFDEINAISNKNTFDFHALLQNRELFIKDADDGRGKVYKMHPDCRIGFAQNPKSAKYIGGNIKPSNFLGRCTYITYPEFKKEEIKKAITIRYPKMAPDDMNKFVEYYFAIIETIDRSQLPVDISIRQLNNVIDLWMAGMNIKDSIEDGLSSILDAVSQPKAKESFFRIAQMVWKGLM